MSDWQKYFKGDNIFFITPDVKRGLGFTGVLPNYHIICSEFDPIIPILRKQQAKIFCLEENKGIDIGKIRNSGKLLETSQVLDYIRDNSNDTPKIMYFKPSLKLDLLISRYGFLPIGNNAKLNEMYEDKINFYMLGKQFLPSYLIPGVAGILGDLEYLDLYHKFGLPFVLQFGHGWAGKTTFFIRSEKEFDSLSEKFPFTKVKISKFIDGFTILNNCCIYNDQVFISSPAVQIDGITPLGGKPGVTCGRQWPAKFIDKKQIGEIKKISQTVGKFMTAGGFKGFFGVDFLVEEKTGKVYLSEVNARMTASSAFFTLIETGLSSIPLLAYHAAQFLGKSISERFEENYNLAGSQIIFRKPFDLSKSGNNLFGVFKKENGKLVLVRREYYPQNLGEDEYIFMGRKEKTGRTVDEFARIETRNEVLDAPRKLKKPLAGFI